MRHDLVCTWGDPGKPFWENVRDALLSHGAYLSIDGDILLTYEFRETANYRALLRALAFGNTTMSDICSETGLDKGMVSKYLSVLCRLHMVIDEIPVTAPAGTRNRHYVISDPFMSFYFRYVIPNRIDLEAGRTAEVLEKIRRSFSEYAGKMFETLCLELIRSGAFLLDLHFTGLGRWWYREQEIDIVGIDEGSRSILFCECKWCDITHADAKRILFDLEKKSADVRWHNNRRRELFCLIGKHIERKDAFRARGYRVYDLDDVSPKEKRRRLFEDADRKMGEGHFVEY